MSDAQRTCILKIGGSEVGPESDLDPLTSLVKARIEDGWRVIVVHGGGREVSEIHETLGHEPRRVRGLRVTPEKEMPAVTMVLRGLVNARLVSALVRGGVSALGMSGVDLGVMSANFLNARELGRVGGPPRVDVDAIERLLGAGVVPVFCSVCLGPDHQPLNVNADTVAHTLAVSLQAESLDFASDVAGVRTEDGIASELRPADVRQLIQADLVTGGMIPKLQAAVAAVSSGVAGVRIGTLASLRAGTATEVHR